MNVSLIAPMLSHPTKVAVFPSPAAQLAWLCNVCGTGVCCCRWRNKFWRNLVLTGCDQVMQYHIPEEQNPQLCYCEASKLTKNVFWGNLEVRHPWTHHDILYRDLSTRIMYAFVVTLIHYALYTHIVLSLIRKLLDDDYTL